MSLAEDFQMFWRAFPRKVGKIAAEKAYQQARKRATAEDILAGIDVYLETKPAYADFCHPKTWLSQGRWLDEMPGKAGDWMCPHVPPCGQTAFRCHQQVQLAEAKAQRTGAV